MLRYIPIIRYVRSLCIPLILPAIPSSDGSLSLEVGEAALSGLSFPREKTLHSLVNHFQDALY